MKTVVVMQPYFFPYLGYFQLVAASSEFVYLNDVAFIKGGWINRNRFLVQGREHLFTVPVAAASSHRSIANTTIGGPLGWSDRFLRLLDQSYARAPNRAATLNLVRQVVSFPHASIAALAEESVRAVCAYVGLRTEWRRSNEDALRSDLKGAARVLNICQTLGADRYVNAPGGKELYDAEVFSRAGIDLRFLRPALPPYDQKGPEFVPGLSIIDLLMFNPREQVRTWMETYELD